jgi:predicted RNA binding protein YcfA (HicA-like mRNA interferase family)
MSRLAKLVERFLKDPPEVDFEIVCLLLAAFGFRQVRASGSHHVFRDSGGRMLVVPKVAGRRVRRAYLRQIVALLGLEEWHEEER